MLVQIQTLLPHQLDQYELEPVHHGLMIMLCINLVYTSYCLFNVVISDARFSASARMCFRSFVL